MIDWLIEPCKSTWRSTSVNCSLSRRVLWCLPPNPLLPHGSLMESLSTLYASSWLSGTVVRASRGMLLGISKKHNGHRADWWIPQPSSRGRWAARVPAVEKEGYCSRYCSRIVRQYFVVLVLFPDFILLLTLVSVPSLTFLPSCISLLYNYLSLFNVLHLCLIDSHVQSI